MSEAAQTMPVEVDLTTPIDASKVVQSYSGKRGCQCGCNGNYYYQNVTMEQIRKHLGYEPDPKCINKGQITRVVKVINQNLSKAKIATNGHYAFVNLDDRTYVVYFYIR